MSTQEALWVVAAISGALNGVALWRRIDAHEAVTFGEAARVVVTVAIGSGVAAQNALAGVGGLMLEIDVREEAP